MDAHYKAHNFREPTFVIPTHIRLRQWGKVSMVD